MRATLILMALVATLQAAAQQPAAVNWNMQPDNPVYLKNDNSHFFLYIDLKGNELKTEKKRAPLNISLVLDRSGSMSGDKIKYAKQAAIFVIEQLTADDYVSIVEYDNVVNVVSASAQVHNKEILKEKINKISDRGSTNMTGGMLKGYDEVASTKKEGYINRVLLLTDGLANVGITDSASICRIAQKKFKEEGIAISTFGLGADYNEDLLTAIAEAGGANYYFIDSPDKIPGIFAKELEGLLSVVAQNTMVTLEFPAPFVECDKVYGYAYTVTGNTVTINFSDVFSKEEKGVIVQFSRAAPLPDALDFTGRLRYTDAQTINNVDNSITVTLKAEGNPAIVKAKADAAVDEMVSLYRSTEMFDEVLREMDRGNYAVAKIKADTLKTYIAVKAVNAKSAKLKKQGEDIVKYADNIETVKTMSEAEKKNYQKANKAANYKVKKGKN